MDNRLRDREVVGKNAELGLQRLMEVKDLRFVKSS